MLGRIRARMTYANVGVTVALVLAATGFAVAAIPGNDGVIHGCFKKTGGQLRLVDAGKKCANTEKAIAFNQRGRRGPAGPGKIVDRARFRGSKATTGATATAIPLIRPTWTQQPGELDQLFGRITFNSPAACSTDAGGIPIPGALFARLLLDGKDVASASSAATSSPSSADFASVSGAGRPVVFDPLAAKPHTLSVQVSDSCGDASNHFTITAVDIDVLGNR